MHFNSNIEKQIRNSAIFVEKVIKKSLKKMRIDATIDIEDDINSKFNHYIEDHKITILEPCDQVYIDIYFNEDSECLEYFVFKNIQTFIGTMETPPEYDEKEVITTIDQKEAILNFLTALMDDIRLIVDESVMDVAIENANNEIKK